MPHAYLPCLLRRSISSSRAGRRGWPHAGAGSRCCPVNWGSEEAERAANGSPQHRPSLGDAARVGVCPCRRWLLAAASVSTAAAHPGSHRGERRRRACALRWAVR
ncbi:hypothetical protein ZWY2020_022329 [Hordeum vulgare]|nr:hypothetical protein ZWY2020_022329 [Hordeum vulgare]